MDRYVQITLKNAKLVEAFTPDVSDDVNEPSVTIELCGVVDDSLKEDTLKDLREKLGKTTFIVMEAVEEASLINVLTGRVNK